MADYIEGEDWRPIVGYEGIYDVSTHGRVRRVEDARRGGWKAGRILVQRTAKNGYIYVRLFDKQNPRRKKYYVHVLVAAAHIGPKPNGLEVNHIDCDKANNHVSNLEYKTHLENIRHSYDDIYIKSQRRITRKVTVERVEELRVLYQTGQYLQKELAKMAGISQSRLSVLFRRPAAPPQEADHE